MGEAVTPAEETPPADLLVRMEALIRGVYDATKGTLPCDLNVRVSVVPGNLVTVSYTASCGDILGKGVNAQRWAHGSSPETAANKLLEQVAEHDIARKVRTEYLRRLAADLGFTVTAKKGK